jgi:pyruvate dehydrogenase E2 component (dihydrolipoamide acetyltransferase)
MREFELPDVGEGVAEGELVGWLVAVGDRVEEDQPVAEVETDKALVEVPAPVDGVVHELRAEEGEVVPVGDVIIVFEPDDAADSNVEADAETADGDAETTADGETPTPGGRTFAAPSTRRLARELGVDLGAVEGSGPGGRITEGDVRAAAETGGAETTRNDEPATAGSASDDDDDRTPAITRRSEASGASGGDLATGSPGVESADRDRTLAVPATRRVAREEGIDLDSVPAAEQRDGEGFVTTEAVREYAEAQRRAQEADAAAVSGESAETEADASAVDTAEAGGETTAVDAPAGDEREPYRGVRRTIGEAMADSKFTAPHVTHFDEVDVTELVETRDRLKQRADERGIRLTYMPFVMKACVAALQEFPYVNSQLDEEAGEIVKRGDYHLGVATATGAGLMVPVVEDVDRKGLLQVASETNELVQKARDRSISPQELRGSTFTITNIGGIGGQFATPIINPPEVAILALGQIQEKPRVVDGEVVPRHVMGLSLSFDHRVLDGAIGARFTNAVKERLRDPELLLLE